MILLKKRNPLIIMLMIIQHLKEEGIHELLIPFIEVDIIYEQ